MKTITLESMRHAAERAGFRWTDAELEAIRPAVERALESLEKLERLPLGDVEPPIHYRVS
jgi:hypothetical protein